tara:strand:- start:436 stop:678 length:243 start_codon:yes stop_codon:yes gene_type:complete
MQKEINQLNKRLRRLGFEPVRRGNNHFFVVCPDGSKVFYSATPSRSSAIHIIMRELSKRGVNLDRSCCNLELGDAFLEFV